MGHRLRRSSAAVATATFTPGPLRAPPIPGLHEDALTERLITRALGAPLAAGEPPQ